MNETRPENPKCGETLTFDELDKDIQERVGRITEEFKDGFDFLKTCRKTVTFFGSARTLPNEDDYIKAKRIAGRISKELNYGVITGGGPGIMEAANCGASEADGISLGLTIDLPSEQLKNSCLSDHMDFHYFFSRKVCLSYAAEAYIYFPGGFGTLDELFEILTLVQTNKIEKVPVILVGKKYWKGLNKFIRKHLLKEGRVSKEDTNLYTITDDEDLILEIIKHTPVR